MMSSSDDDAQYKFPVGKEAVREAIEELVKKEGIEKVSSSYIRNHLKEKFNADFTDYKRDVDYITMKVINNMPKKEEPPAEGEADDTAEHDTSTNTKAEDSSDSDSDHGIASTDRRAPVTKGIKRKAAKEKESLPAANAITADDEPPRKRAAAKKAEHILTRNRRIEKIIQKKKARAGPDNGDNSGKFGRMTKLCLLSDELQAFTQKKFMKRCDVMKVMWAYLREKNLFDPKDKRFALVNDELAPLFKGRNKFRAFSMMKFLSKHIYDPQHLSEEVHQEALAEQERLRALMLEKRAAGESARKEDADDKGDVPSDADDSSDDEEKGNDDEEKNGNNEEDSD